jgi:glycosyltransferase involved in cell wall biosynthesis
MQHNMLLRQYKAVLVASKHMRQEFSRHGVPDNRLCLLPLPITDLSPQKSAPGFRMPRGRILFIGRLTPLKGLKYLIAALPNVQRALSTTVQLTVAGSGPQEQELREYSKCSKIDIHFTGWADGQTRVKLLGESDLLVVPSLWPEPFGLVGLEAACLGVPSAAFDVGGIPDWLQSGETGELAPADPPSPDGIALAIVRVLRDPQHYNRLCAGAWEKTHAFNLCSHVTGLDGIFENARMAQVSP